MAPPVFRCKAYRAHKNVQDQCYKARDMQMGPLQPLEPLPPVRWMDEPKVTRREMNNPQVVTNLDKDTSLYKQSFGEGASTSSSRLAQTLPSRVAWFPRGVQSEMNNQSMMMAGITTYKPLGLDGGTQTTNVRFFGGPKKRPITPCTYLSATGDMAGIYHELASMREFNRSMPSIRDLPALDRMKIMPREA
eukprot:TRINITY_DN23704_c0_g3_i2.p1 TRINITY_DN23704_c0_g3~~TRINITY_DN23704_c0_g3_i2.p1  ORF type:complete len:191 (-),score=20.72 TRINITY_DN23704_c0_g3_i2:134-706(-)